MGYWSHVYGAEPGLERTKSVPYKHLSILHPTDIQRRTILKHSSVVKIINTVILNLRRGFIVISRIRGYDVQSLAFSVWPLGTCTVLSYVSVCSNTKSFILDGLPSGHTFLLFYDCLLYLTPVNFSRSLSFSPQQSSVTLIKASICFRQRS